MHYVEGVDYISSDCVLSSRGNNYESRRDRELLTCHAGDTGQGLERRMLNMHVELGARHGSGFETHFELWRC